VLLQDIALAAALIAREPCEKNGNVCILANIQIALSMQGHDFFECPTGLVHDWAAPTDDSTFASEITR
jgi:hypothetical protein